jgi:hypothetical protein
VSSVALSYSFYRMEGDGETQPVNGLEKITMGSDSIEPVL